MANATDILEENSWQRHRLNISAIMYIYGGGLVFPPFQSQGLSRKL